MSDTENIPLHEQTCRAMNAEEPSLSPDVADGMLQKLSGWSREDAVIHQTFTFKNYYETVSFVNAVAWIANTQDHHPDIAFGYKTCTVRYTTHSVGGLSENDFICAARIDRLLTA